MVCHGKIGVIFLVIPIFKLATSSTPEDKVLTYERLVNASIQLEKQDKLDIKTWSEDFQVQMVEVTTKYRLEMTRHQRHSFKRKSKNKRWFECLKFYESATNKLEQAYYIRENKCLKNASSADGDKKQAVFQIGKEIQKWRRTYRYLVKICRNGVDIHSDCLVKYMEGDNYDHAFPRLMTLRSEAIQDLRQEMTRAVEVLGDCLQATLSSYLEGVRTTMNVLRKCYGEMRLD